MTEEAKPSNQRAPRFVKNPSGYHSRGANPKEKAYNFGMFLKDFGWTGGWVENEDTGDVTVTLTRGGEKIEVFWTSPIPWPEVWYHYAGSKIKCRNVSQAALFGQGQPDPDRMRRGAGRLLPSRVGNGRGNAVPGVVSTGSAEPPDVESVIDEVRGTLPFDRESSAEEIFAVLKPRINPVLIWVNRLSGQVQQDYIKTWSRHFKITSNKDGKLIIHFAGAHQFNAVYVDSIIGVS